MKINSIISFFLSIILIVATFFGFSKFISWYSTFNSIIFYFLCFWFIWVIKMLPSRIDLIKKGLLIRKEIGYKKYEKLKITLQIISLIISWSYFLNTIIQEHHLYNGSNKIGLISFILFVFTSTLTLTASLIIPIEHSLSKKF